MLQTETIGTFNEIAARLPRLDGKRIAISTLWRWATKGCRGVKLEARRLGGRFVTSLEAVDRFSAKLAELDAAPRSPQPQPESSTIGTSGKRRSEAQCKAANELAKKELSAARW